MVYISGDAEFDQPGRLAKHSAFVVPYGQTQESSLLRIIDGFSIGCMLTERYGHP